MPLKAFEDFAPEPLAFPIRGKTYTAPPVGMAEGIRLQQIVSGKDDSLTDSEPDALWRLVMGPAWDEMLADNVPAEAASRAAFAALTDFQFGREMAERVWESGLSPEALAAREAASSSQPGPASTRSKSTVGARKTRKRASTTGTTSPQE